jgi:hypothetical protein
MFLSVLFAGVFLSVAFAASDCSKYPNGTDVHVVWLTCEDVSSVISLYDLHFQDAKTHEDEFPIKVYQPLDIVIEMFSPIEFPSFKLDIDIYSLNNDCSWNKIPTFGLL